MILVRTEFSTATSARRLELCRQNNSEKCPLVATLIPHLIPNVINLPLKVTSLFHLVLCNGRPLIAISQRGEGREGEHVYLCVCTCLSAPLTQLLAGGVIHGPDRCLVQLDLSLIIPKAWTALSFTIAQIISVLTAEPSVTAP